MSEKTVIRCDAYACCQEHEHEGDDFLLKDIKGWLYVPTLGTHYCPPCAKEIVDQGELDSDYIIGND
jgi:hypothetical protein